MFMLYRKFEEIDEVIISNELTDEDATKIRPELEYVVRRGKSRVLLNLSSLSSIGHRAVSVLHFCLELSRRLNGNAVLLNPCLRVSNQINRNEYGNRFSICHSRKSAIKFLNS